MFTTLNEWIALALTFLGGWLLGLATHPGGRKWRDRYNLERDTHAAVRRDYEAKLTAAEARIAELQAERARSGQHESRIAELTRERDGHGAELARGREELSLAHARIRELERENAQFRTTPQPLPASVTATHPQTVVTRPATSEARSEPMPLTRRVVGGRSGRGWFDWGPSADPRAHRG